MCTVTTMDRCRNEEMRRTVGARQNLGDRVERKVFMRCGYAEYLTKKVH